NIVDVLDTQRRLYAAVRNYNNARYDYILDNLRLKQAAGTLNPGDLEDLARYLKPDYDPDRDFLPPDFPKPCGSVRGRGPLVWRRGLRRTGRSGPGPRAEPRRGPGHHFAGRARSYGVISRCRPTNSLPSAPWLFFNTT